MAASSLLFRAPTQDTVVAPLYLIEEMMETKRLRAGRKTKDVHYLEECIVLSLEVSLRLLLAIEVAQIDRLTIFVRRIPCCTINQGLKFAKPCLGSPAEKK